MRRRRRRWWWWLRCKMGFAFAPKTERVPVKKGIIYACPLLKLERPHVTALISTETIRCRRDNSSVQLHHVNTL